jgi:hypothetical protein
MARNRIVILALAVAVFLAAGGYLVVRNAGGGGSPRSIALSVTGSTMTPDTPTAKQGDRVTMTITADKAEEIHLHGYDIHFSVPDAGGSVSHTFAADKSGSFELELEATSTHLGQFQVSP